MKNESRIKYACYATNVSMAAIGSLSPVLFITFHDNYGISYSLLGLLVLINFVTQLSVDLILSFFSHKFNLSMLVKTIPILTAVGFLIYGIWPFFFSKSVYLGLVLGTIVFSASGGLSEVLMSPLVAALPSEEPEHEMSKLHSIYAWGVVGVIIFATLFLQFAGDKNWMYLPIVFTSIPVVAFALFFKTTLPDLQTGDKVTGVAELLKNKQLWLCVFAIFLGGASECTMAQWSSGYLEQALGIPKVWGDVFGVALFSVALGLGRSLYAKHGENIEKFLLLGAIGAAVCYLLAAVSPFPFIGLIACACTGFCVSMMWPGSLIVSSKRIPAGGVFVYAMMASGGDLGASIAPQLVGIVADGVGANTAFSSLAKDLGITLEQLGMKCGMLLGMFFPIVAIGVYAWLVRSEKTRKKKGTGNG